VISYEDSLLVKALKDGPWDCGMSLSWLSDTESENAMVRLQDRRLAVKQAREERLNSSSD
jgi:hypothetical protein